MNSLVCHVFHPCLMGIVNLFPACDRNLVSGFGVYHTFHPVIKKGGIMGRFSETP